jgi:hypothetical protein
VVVRSAPVEAIRHARAEAAGPPAALGAPVFATDGSLSRDRALMAAAPNTSMRGADARGALRGAPLRGALDPDDWAVHHHSQCPSP